MLTNSFITPEAWDLHLVPQLIKAKLPLTTPVSCVFYTDGGCKPTPTGIAGWGVHGYVYLDTHTKIGHGCKGFTPTARGHILHTPGKIDDIKAKAVTVLGYIDGLGCMPAPSTNNIAELLGFINCLELITNAIKPAKCLFRLDSKYVMTNVMENMTKWKANNWLLKSGEPAANVNLWKRVDALVSLCERLGIVLSYEWVKGHSDDIGNTQADLLASTGLHAGLNVSSFTKFRLYDTRYYWNKTADYHPFLNESRWYYNTGSQSLDCGGYSIYHLGNHNKSDSDNLTVGKRVSDAHFAVVALTKPDPALETLRRYHDDRLRDYGDVVVVGMLDNIMKPATYECLTDGDTDFMCFDGKTGELVTVEKVSLTDELYPARISLRAVDELLDIESVLRTIIDNSMGETIVLTNITDLVYEQTTEKSKPVCKLRIPVGKEFTVLKTTAKYWTASGLMSTTLSIAMGLDMPMRNTLLGVKDNNPVVSVVTWPEIDSPIAFRYACIIRTDDALGIWVSPYANLRVMA